MHPPPPLAVSDAGLIRSASLRGFPELVRELGGDPLDLLEQHGIDPEVLEADDGVLPITGHDLMLDRAAVELACPDLGLRLAAAQDLTILGPLAVAIEASGTVNEALECVTRFLFVHSPALRIAVEEDPSGAKGVVAITYRKQLRESPYSPQAMELGIGLLFRISTALVGTTAGLRSVDLPHAPMSPLTRYTEVFGDRVRFGTEVAALRVDQRTMDVRFAGADEAIRALAIAHLARDHRDPGQTTSVRVHRLLVETIGTTGHALADVARLLAIHPRTLQRALAAEGTTYEAVLDDVRRTLSLRLISTSTLPLAQISTMVGFTSQSTLTRAVRRWTGSSPREVRSTRGGAGQSVALSQVLPGRDGHAGRHCDRTDPGGTT